MRISARILFLFIFLAGGLTQAEVVLRWTGGTGVPTKEVNVALVLSKDQENLASLKARVKLPPELEYGGAKLGLSAEMNGVKFKAEPGNPSEIELQAGPSGSLPDGVVASIDLKVKADAKIGSTVKIEAEATARSVQGQDTVVRSEVEDIAIVETEPVVSCFFYMH
ncbi:MAG: hypothetical protein HY315_09020 [Acidobacteria bacterium]|nr:hypothetical protein [Acidobacteriota bacterium]